MKYSCIQFHPANMIKAEVWFLCLAVVKNGQKQAKSKLVDSNSISDIFWSFKSLIMLHENFILDQFYSNAPCKARRTIHNAWPCFFHKELLRKKYTLGGTLNSSFILSLSWKNYEKLSDFTTNSCTLKNNSLISNFELFAGKSLVCKLPRYPLLSIICPSDHAALTIY